MNDLTTIKCCAERQKLVQTYHERVIQLLLIDYSKYHEAMIVLYVYEILSYLW